MRRALAPVKPIIVALTAALGLSLSTACSRHAGGSTQAREVAQPGKHTQAEKERRHDFRNAQWGDDPGTVRKHESLPMIEEHTVDMLAADPCCRRSRYGPGSFAGVPVDAQYCFE